MTKRQKICVHGRKPEEFCRDCDGIGPAKRAPSADVAANLRSYGRADVLNALVEDRKRLTLGEREAIEALQTWALRAATLLEQLPSSDKGEGK